MLLQFSVRNFKTFKDKVTLSLVASNYDRDTLKDENVIAEKKYGFRLLKSAIVYGANASGKTNLLEAFAFMRYFVMNSSRESKKDERINVHPFRLSVETENEPSEFEVIFLSDNVLFRYGFEVTQQKIFSEWLYYKPKTKEIELFYRDGNNFDIHERSFAKARFVAKEGIVRDNALLLSVAAQFNETKAIIAMRWFQQTVILSGFEEDEYRGFTMGKMEIPIHKVKILELIKAADLGIHDISLKTLDVENLPKEMSKDVRDEITKKIVEEKAMFVSTLTIHKKYDTNKEIVDHVIFSLSDDESSGTIKFFAFIGPILDVIENGYTMMIDELDSKLHPNLVRKIVSLFNSKDFNRKNAQLIFNTHDTNLLDSELLRRDQIWFTDKNRYGEAKLYALADFKSDEVRKNEPYEDNYIRGKYGAVPLLGFFDNLNQILSQYENEK